LLQTELHQRQAFVPPHLERAIRFLLADNLEQLALV
jgi:hypothetical protein